MPSAEYEPPIPSQDFSFDSFQDINSGLEKAAEQYPIISPTFGSFFNTQNTKKKFRNPPGLSFKTVTGKSLSEALIFAEHWENMLCTKVVLNVRNNFCTQHVLPRFELGIFM